MNKSINVIDGGTHTDARGKISFINDFKLDAIKRMYTIEHPDISVVRAWQGHKIEQKWFFVTTGSFKFVIVELDNWVSPTNNLIIKEFILNGDTPQILHIPGGYLNGFKALEPNSKIMVFSDFTVEQSMKDDYRFNANLFFNWNNS